MAKTAKPRLEAQQLQVAILVYPGCSTWVATSLREAFTLANLLRQAGPEKLVDIEAQWIGAQAGPIATSAGVVIEVPMRRRGLPDVLVVPPVWHVSAADFEHRLGKLQPEVALLRQLSQQGVTIASVCSGVALLAVAGLVEGRAATGCWWLELPLRQRYPGVRWQFNDTLVRDGSVVTAGSGSAYASLVFELLERAAGRMLAVRTAKFLGIEPNQQRQSTFAQLIPMTAPEDPLVARFERHVWDHLADGGLEIEAVAAALHTSGRTLYRRVQAATGNTPLRFVQRARLEHAKSLLAETSLKVDEICERCGWRDVSSFRKLFTREVGMTAAAWRRGFGMTPGDPSG